MSDKHVYQSGKVTWESTPDFISGAPRNLIGEFKGPFTVTDDLIVSSVGNVIDYIDNSVNSISLETLKPGTVNNQILYWNNVSSDWEVNLFDIEKDISPKLGGNLDVSANTIYTLNDNDIIFFPDSGRMIIDVPGDAIITTSPGESLYIVPESNLWLKENAWPNNVGSSKQVLTSDGGGFTQWTSLPYDIDYYWRGAITLTNTVYGSFLATRSIKISSTDGASRARCKTASLGTVVYDIVHNSVTVGTITFTVSNLFGTLSFPADINILAGDLVEIKTTSTVDFAIQDVSVTLSGVLI